MQNHLPSFTPTESDNCAFVNVDVAQSTSLSDIHDYLLKTKATLHIGEPGFPSKILVSGDQQTFSIVKKLIAEHPDLFDWIQPYPGDWHLLKLAAETLRDLLKDGGFSDLARDCGLNKEVNQWKDINTLLIALDESLLHESVKEWEEVKKDGIPYSEFLETQQNIDNKDEISRFWVQMLVYLYGYCAYFFAIRSVNWALRNAALPMLEKLFFAFSHDKYEELVCGHLRDIMAMPTDIVTRFKEGEWTTSVKGRPYHNLALDGANECLINRKLKELTRNANEFNTVTLANFIAFLEQFLEKMTGFVYRHSKKIVGVTKSKHNRFLHVIRARVHSIRLLASTTKRVLVNSFSANAPPLDDEQRRDLLRIAVEGRSRMLTYIKQYMI